MSDRSPNLNMPYLLPSQAQKHVTHNEALQQLDAVVQLSVLAFDATVPPSAPEAGQRFALGSGATGAWAGHDSEIAVWDGNVWQFVTPLEGWHAWGNAEGEQRVFQNGAWSAPTPEMLGINTSADPTNRFAVASDATLLTHDGTDHQLKINKAAASDTSSLVLQSDWTGHAEMGLAGNNNWSLKVSPDGTGWTEALTIDAATGLASGAAVQSGPTDITPGRLMRSDYGYGPGNLIGPVGENSGVPTGAAIESGTNAADAYIKFADGTMICRTAIYMTYNATNRLRATWVYPQAFAETPQVVATLDLNDFLSNSTPSASSISGVSAGAILLTQAKIYLYRISGMTNFAAGDSALVYVSATGRWF